VKGPALALRTVHASIAAVELTSLGYVWWCALTRRRSRALHVAVAALWLEGAALVVGRGDCPLGPLQDRLGDPVPLFELALPPKAAKAAVPVLTGVALAGLGLLVWRRPPDPGPRTPPPPGRT
jgi:hypothetical protein